MTPRGPSRGPRDPAEAPAGQAVQAEPAAALLD